jgi:hypothetical protein
MQYLYKVKINSLIITCLTLEALQQAIQAFGTGEKPDTKLQPRKKPAAPSDKPLTHKTELAVPSTSYLYDKLCHYLANNCRIALEFLEVLLADGEPMTAADFRDDIFIKWRGTEESTEEYLDEVWFGLEKCCTACNIAIESVVLMPKLNPRTFTLLGEFAIFFADWRDKHPEFRSTPKSRHSGEVAASVVSPVKLIPKRAKPAKPGAKAVAQVKVKQPKAADDIESLPPAILSDRFDKLYAKLQTKKISAFLRRLRLHKNFISFSDLRKFPELSGSNIGIIVGMIRRCCEEVKVNHQAVLVVIVNKATGARSVMLGSPFRTYLSTK